MMSSPTDLAYSSAGRCNTGTFGAEAPNPGEQTMGFCPRGASDAVSISVAVVSYQGQGLGEGPPRPGSGAGHVWWARSPPHTVGSAPVLGVSGWDGPGGRSQLRLEQTVVAWRGRADSFVEGGKGSRLSACARVATPGRVVCGPVSVGGRRSKEGRLPARAQDEVAEDD